MKILILQDNFFPEARGGAAVVASELAKKFLANGHEVSVIAATQNKDLVGKSNMNGVNVHRIFSKYHERWRAYMSLYNPQTVGKIKQILADVKPDIVHVHNVHQHLSYHALKLAKRSGARVFLTAHDSMLYAYEKADDESKISWFKQMRDFKLRFNPFRNILVKYYLRYVEKVITVSNSLKRSLVNNGVINVAVVYNGVNLDDWVVGEQSITDFKNRFSLSGRKVILLGGRLGISKGGGNIVRALAKIEIKIPETLLLVIGEGTYANAIKRLARELKISDSIVFTGWLEHAEMAAAYNATDVVVFPSTYPDPFGMVNIEAMACSKPVVATCFGGAKEIVVDGETGFIINPLDIETMARKITEVLTDPVKSERFGLAGYERVQNLFTSQIQTDAYLKLFMVA